MMHIETRVVEVIDDKEVTQICLINDKGVEVKFLTLGATWQEFLVPDENGTKKNLILGFDKPSDYWNNSLCACQSIGRVAGRINGGKAIVGGQEIQLPQNEKGNCLHGGGQGFNKQIWDYKIHQQPGAVSVTMTYLAKEEVDGFPGDMTVAVTITLKNDNRLSIVYSGYDATKTTLFNPTNHVYFNLSHQQNLNSHRLVLHSDTYLQTRDDLIPTGEKISLAGTAYDFNQSRNLGEAIEATGGFDDAFLVEPSMISPILTLSDISGSSINMYSDRNAIVMYTMNSIDRGIYISKDRGKEAEVYEGVALEAQTLPDAINHDGFGDITLSPGETKSYHIVFEYLKK